MEQKHSDEKYLQQMSRYKYTEAHLITLKYNLFPNELRDVVLCITIAQQVYG